MRIENHYNWLDKNWKVFLINIDRHDLLEYSGMIGAHGDKCYSYRYEWENRSIPFSHGVALYLLTYLSPWKNEVRETKNGWVDPYKWINDNYDRFREFLPEA